MPEEPIQNIESDNCGSFHLYFYKNMFGAAMECELLDHKKLTKVLLNESFFTRYRQQRENNCLSVLINDIPIATIE